MFAQAEAWLASQHFPAIGPMGCQVRQSLFVKGAGLCFHQKSGPGQNGTIAAAQRDGVKAFRPPFQPAIEDFGGRRLLRLLKISGFSWFNGCGLHLRRVAGGRRLRHFRRLDGRICWRWNPASLAAKLLFHPGPAATQPDQVRAVFCGNCKP